MKFILLSLLLSSFASSSHAAVFDQLQLAKSTLSFVSKQMNVPVEGKFSKFSAQLHFDPDKLDTSQVKIEIRPDSIDAGGQEANEIAKGKGWFHVSAFPTAQFIASQIKVLKDNRYEVSGHLTIKGITHPVVAPFTFQQTGKTAELSGSFVIKRLDFGIGDGVWSDVDVVANEVKIDFKFIVLAE